MKDRTIKLWLAHYGINVEVYFNLFKEACPNCIRRYLTNGLGSEPVLFRLKDIIENEVIAGGKIEDLYPAGGKQNVCCARILTVKPENGKWDDKLLQYMIVRNTYGVKRKSKIVVTIKEI